MLSHCTPWSRLPFGSLRSALTGGGALVVPGRKSRSMKGGIPMNARQIIRDTLAELVTITRDDIENAVMALDLADMIQEAVEEYLPEAIKQAVEEEIEAAVEEAIDGALS